MMLCLIFQLSALIVEVSLKKNLTTHAIQEEKIIKLKISKIDEKYD